MSIIERAAELLRTARQDDRQASTAGEGVRRQGDDLIERAANLLVHLREGSSNEERTRDAHVAGVHSGRPAQTVKIDRERLRQQSMIVPDGGRTPIAESFRRIKRQILANIPTARADGPPANLVMVTSALPGEGKTFCAINLAISIAMEVNRTVLLVDADVAKADVPRALGFSAESGLMDLLLDKRTEPADVLLNTDIAALTILPAGSPNKNATELLASEAMSTLLHDLAQRYSDRIVIFDAPPLLAASEASVLAGQMGQVVVVVEAEKTSETALKDALACIDASKVAGLILNKGQGTGLQYGYYGYG